MPMMANGLVLTWMDPLAYETTWMRLSGNPA